MCDDINIYLLTILNLDDLRNMTSVNHYFNHLKQHSLILSKMEKYNTLVNDIIIRVKQSDISIKFTLNQPPEIYKQLMHKYFYENRYFTCDKPYTSMTLCYYTKFYIGYGYNKSDYVGYTTKVSSQYYSFLFELFYNQYVDIKFNTSAC